MLDAADQVSQKHFPIGIAIIDLLLVNATVNASQEVYAGIASLKDIMKDAWGVIDSGVGRHAAASKKEAQDY